MKNLLCRFKAILAILTFIFLFVQSASAQVTVSGAQGFPIGTSISGIAYGNGVYVAVGASGYILKSSDGTSWSVEKTSSFLNTSYYRVAFGNSLFVAVSTDGKIVTSPDGSNWTQRTSGTANFLTDIAYGNSKFIAVGYNNTALSSPDGITWTALNVGAGSTDYLQTIIYAAGKFVIGERDNPGGNSRSFYSTTGSAGTWSNVYIETSAQSLNKLVYVNNKFFAFTVLSNIYSSNDAISWTPVVNSRLTTPNQVSSAFYDGTTYFFIGSCSEHSNTAIFTSTDGTTFSLQSQKSTLVPQYAAYVNGRRFILGNEGLISSSNGINWSFPGGSYNAVATNGTRYVAVGQVASNEASIHTSTDWNNWTNVTPSIFRPLFGVAYGNGKFVAVGNTDASSFGTVARSSDGITWTVGNSGIADGLRSIVYANSKFVAVGLLGRIIYSSDGISWTSAENGTGYNYNYVGFMNNYFIAVGGSVALNGASKVKYSSNGISWTDVSPSPAVLGHFHSIAYGNGKYTLVGRDNVSGVQKFISTTTSNITSNSGYSPTIGATTPEGDVSSVGFGGIVYNNSIFTAITNLKVAPFSAYILTSADGSSWTATAANTTGKLRGIIADGSEFKVVGVGDTRLTVNAGTTLPLRLVNFYARNNNGNTSLHWKTANEENVNRFEIEYCNDGRVFSKTAEVTAAGSGNNTYSFIDAARTGIKYYRLKMVDIDGKFTYSPVLRIADEKSNSISIYPNPAADFVTVSLQQDKPGDIRVFNNEGRQVLQQQISSNSEVITINQLPKGIYIVKVKQDGKTYSEKLVKK